MIYFLALKIVEIANAYLVGKPSGICLHVVCYVAKDKYKFIWEHPVTKHGKIKKDNGLLDLCERLAESKPGMELCELNQKDIQRHEIIESILEMYS